MAYSFKLSGEKQQVKPGKWFLAILIEFVMLVAQHGFSQEIEIVHILRRLAPNGLPDKHKLKPHPILCRRRNFEEFAIQFKAPDDLVDCVFILIDVGVVSDMRIIITVQLIPLSFWYASIPRLEVELETGGDRLIVSAQRIARLGNEIHGVARFPASEQVVDLRPEIVSVDHLSISVCIRGVRLD